MRWREGSAIALAALVGCAGAGAEAADHELEQGLLAQRAGHAREAYDHFVQAAADRPDDDLAYRHLVDLARAVGRLDALTRQARERLKDHPGEARAHYRLGLCAFAHLGGEKEGLAELAEAARLAADDGEYQLRLGAGLLEAEHPAEALVPLQAAVALAPADPHRRLPLALALHRCGRDLEAIAQIAAALPFGPSLEDLKAFAHLRDRIGDRSRAVPASVRPRFEDALATLSQAEVPARAIELLEALAAEQPALAPVQTALGLAYLRGGDNAQAVAHLRQAIALDPLPAEPYLYLGQVFQALGRSTEARAQLRLAAERDPLLEAAHDQLAQLALQDGDTAEAIRETRSLVGLRRGDIASRLRLAQALSATGDLEGAEAELHAVAVAELPSGMSLDHQAAELTRREAELGLGSLEIALAERTRDAAERGRRFGLAKHWLDLVLKADPNNFAAQKLSEQLPK